jgi:hypothetical protein
MLALNPVNPVVALRVLYPRLWPITASNAKLRIGGQHLVEEAGVGVSSLSYLSLRYWLTSVRSPRSHAAQ